MPFFEKKEIDMLGFLFLLLVFLQSSFSTSYSSSDESHSSENHLNRSPTFSNRNGELFNIIADAGSTGTRIYIYTYAFGSPLSSLRELSHKRVQPPLSSLYNDEDKLTLQLGKLIEFAKKHVPNELWASTNIALKATAGLRSLPQEQQDWLIDKSRKVLSGSGFRFDNFKTRVINGSEEALFDLLAITATFQMHKSIYGDECRECYGAADLGGSSQQLAFILPSASSLSSSLPSCAPDWKLSIPGLPEENYIFSKSMKSMGLIAAMDRVILSFYKLESNQNHHHHHNELKNSMTEISTDGTIDIHRNSNSRDIDLFESIVIVNETERKGVRAHPCLPPGIFQSYELTNPNPSSALAQSLQSLEGKGSFSECHLLIQKILPVQQNLSECVHLLRPSKIVGMDNFPKILEVLHLSNQVDGVSPAQIYDAGTILCQRPWEVVLADFPPGFMPYRAQRACFAAAFVYTMLTDVFSIAHNESAFLPVENLPNGQEFSWTLGAVLLDIIGGSSLEAINSNNW